MTDTLFPEFDTASTAAYAKPNKGRRANKTGRTQYRRRAWEDATEPAAWPGVYKAFGLPVPSPSSVPPGPDKVEVMRRRHERRERLWHPADAGARPLTADDAFGRMMKENATGVEVLPDDVERVNPYRAHPWDGERHVHLGYFPKWEQACYAVRLWHACCGTIDDDGIDCAKWFPQGDWTDETLAKLSEADIERIARARRF